LIGGSTIWMLMLAAFVMTGNIALLPAIALIGAGVVPLAIVLRDGERLAGTGLILDDLLYAFFYGGAVGILIGGFLDAEVGRHVSRSTSLLSAGLVEEAASRTSRAIEQVGPRQETAILGRLLLGVFERGDAGLVMRHDLFLARADDATAPLAEFDRGVRKTLESVADALEGKAAGAPDCAARSTLSSAPRSRVAR